MKIKFQNIRAEITRNNWTIEQFCEKLGVSKGTFYKWEEKGDFPISYAVKMTEIFAKPLDYLLVMDELRAQ